MPDSLQDDPSWLADWSEALVLTTGGKVSRGRLKYFLAAGIDGSDPDGIELLTSDVLAEIRRRIHRTGTSSALVVSPRGLECTTDGEARYVQLFLVLMSMEPSARQRGLGSYPVAFWPDRVFEHIVRFALEAWTHGRSFVFTEMAPPSATRGFTSALRELGATLRVEAHPERAKPQRKDHGLDVVAWREFGDGKLGHPLLLCQCTLSSKGLVAKAREVVRAEWGELLDIPQESIDRGLAIPHVLPPGHPDWRDLTRNTDLVLDRLRLLELLAGIPSLGDVILPAWKPTIQERANEWLARQPT